jgi:hypothetical protein
MPGLFCAGQTVPEANHPARAAPALARASPHTESNDGYVGSLACSRCHAAIYNHFARTSMGRSMTPVTPEFLRTMPTYSSIYDPKLDRHFEVTSKDGKLYQSEYQVDAEGKEVFRSTHPIQWIIGANANGFGALIESDDYLFEAPLSYYRQTGKWELSPGYERADNGFTRVIAPGCIFCHTGRAQPASASLGKYENPAFSQLSVGCENCHGPGAAHVDSASQGNNYPKGKDPSIVNPAGLAPSLANDICMSCHQTGDTRVFQPGKTYLDFRPGAPLDRVMAILMVPPTRANPPDKDHVQHYYSMIMSKCYRASEAKPASEQMRCITCHDPHIEPTSAEAPAYFNGKCMTCHTAQSCKAPAKARASSSPADNCISCHMPKRDVSTISHDSVTNHRILARPDEPFPDEAFEQTTSALPDLIHLNRVPGDNSPVPAITLLQAYAQLKNDKPEYNASWLETLSGLERSELNNDLVQTALGHKALTEGRLDDALEHLQNSLRINPAQPAVYTDLSDIDDQKEEPEEAVAMAGKAATLDPFNASVRKTLILRMIAAKQYEEAQAQMEKYLEDFPQDDFMRKMLAIAKEP